MTNDELNKLQRYIGKHPQGQSKEQVVAHIERIDKKMPLSEKEWCKLSFPVCGNGDVAMLDFLLTKVRNIPDAKEYMLHTLRFRKNKLEYEYNQVEILKRLSNYIPESDRIDVYTDALVNAAWFGEYEAAKFLIDSGADITFIKNGKSILEYSQNAIDKFDDYRVHDYICALLQ